MVGGGHNGLTAAAYLARAGFTTLVLERRDIVGGCCVTEEIAPGCRVSTTSYIASMLRPEVISDLRLRDYGLRMVPCDPAIQVPFPDGHVVPWWADRERAKEEFKKISAKDAETFVQVDDRLKKLARYLQPFFMEPPPEIDTRSMRGWTDLFRIGSKFRGISSDEISQLISFLTGSLGEFLDHNYESEKMKTMFLANNVYGKHGGPYQPGTAIGLLFHLLSGGEHELQGFYGHVMGGMGAITQALAASGRKLGVEIRTSSPVAHIDVREGRARGVVLEDGTEIRARIVLSNADPKRTFLKMVAESELPEDFLHSIRGIKMEGPCAKVNLVLDAEPQFHRNLSQRHRSRTHLLHACTVAGVCRALLRHCQVRRNPRRALGGLCGLLQCRSVARALGQTHSDLLCAVCPISSARRQLGRQSRTAGQSCSEKDWRIRAKRSQRDCRAPGSDPARPRAHLRTN